jgi:hypothetical protein
MPGGYVVRDATGQALAHICSTRQRSRSAAGEDAHQRRDEARRLAINVARLPELLGKGYDRRRLDSTNADIGRRASYRSAGPPGPAWPARCRRAPFGGVADCSTIDSAARIVQANIDLKIRCLDLTPMSLDTFKQSPAAVPERATPAIW